MFVSVLKCDKKTAQFGNLNFSLQNHFVWEVISGIRQSSPDETPWRSSKILRSASYFQLTTRLSVSWRAWSEQEKTMKLFFLKYARAVWNEAENRERDLGRDALSPHRACEARALRARETLTARFTDFFTDFEKKTDCFAVYLISDTCTVL